MTQEPEMKGEKIYEMELDLTGVTDYGVSHGRYPYWQGNGPVAGSPI